MSLLWTDGTWTTEAAVSGYYYEAPIPGVTTRYIRRQDFIVQASSYSPPAMSAQDGTTGYYFVGDSPLVDIGGGMSKFTRSWVYCPTGSGGVMFSYSEYETFAYSFIGFYGAYGINTTTVEGRDRIAKRVNSQVLHEFFLCTTGRTYTSPGAIPINYANRYLYGTLDVDWLADSPPFTSATTPSKTTYVGWIADAVSNKWSATVNQGRLCAEDSTLERWMGDVYLRKTRYVLAQ